MNTNEVMQWLGDYGIWGALIVMYPLWYVLGVRIGRLIRSKRKPKIIVRHMHNGVVQQTVVGIDTRIE